MRLNYQLHVLLLALVLLLASCTTTTERPSNTEFEVLARVSAEGDFAALVDFNTLTLTPLGNNCLLVVAASLIFSGTLEGEAHGETTALVFAPCQEVLAHPPGTFRDVFLSELVFAGTVNGTAATADVTYQGSVQEGGDIAGLIRLANGLQGVLKVEAVVAVGGSYSGWIKVE